MNERVRKVIIFLTLPIALVWGIYNLPSSEDQAPIESEPSAAETNLTVVEAVDQQPDACMINVAQKELEDWGADPFRGSRVKNDRPRPSSVSWSVRGIIFSTSDPIAYVNGKAVRVGDTVDQARVKAINRKSVVIDYQGREIELSVRKG